MMSPLLAAAALVALFPAAAPADASVEEALAAKVPGVEAENIRATPVPGLWEVAVGAQVVYLSEDGRYMVRGELIDLMTGQNMTGERQNELQTALANRLSKEFDEARMVVFSPENPRHTITVFTDIDCGYCRKLHREIEDYNKRGIKVRYMFYPLAGPGSDSWAKADAVWCSPDRNKAMTRAKLGEAVTATQPCQDTPAAKHFELGSQLGVRGTPTIVTEDGQILGGYLPADQLQAYLDGQ
jgi:thiol:disulfide interchange protein DsbC